MARKKIEENYMETKQKIIWAAVELLVELGFSKFTLAAVAERVGVTKAAIYWYFPSKEKLIEEVADTLRDDYLHKAQAIANSSAEPYDKIKEIFCHRNHPEESLICILPIKLFFEFFKEDHIIKEIIQQSYKEFNQIIAGILQEGMVSGVFSSKMEPLELAGCITSIMDSVVLSKLLLGHERKIINDQMLFEMIVPYLIQHKE